MGEDPLREIYDQVPYAFGLYSQFGYKDYLNCEGNVKQFVQELKTLCMQTAGNNTDAKVENVLMMYAHNGFKADIPLIYKALLNDSEFIARQNCESGQSTIIINVDFQRGDTKVRVQFLDFINQIKGSLADIAKRFGVPTQKQDVDHNIINARNYQEEIIRQNLQHYLKCDCESLY